jgi:DNA-binding winged helix-turn-helix (wHTH) protein/tetratricopeptide (TPR) repeat protein
MSVEIQAGKLRLDLSRYELSRDGRPVKLERQPMELLIFLVQRKGQLVTRDDIVEKLWGKDVFVDVDRSINAAIRKIRAALKDHPDQPKFLETVVGKGYRWIGEIELIPASPKTLGKSPEIAEFKPVVSHSGWRGRPALLISTAGRLPWKIFIPAAAVLVIILITGGLLYRSRRSQVLSEKDTIVVSDFINTTGEAVFDDTLKQALTTQLEQSPFLNILPEQSIRETLRLMGRSPNERLIPDVAREICQRTQRKAILAGSISRIGTSYVLVLQATNCITGDSLGSEETEADSRERVLKALGKATTALRTRLGESLATIQKFDTPSEQVTTPSLEALKAYSLGMKALGKGDYSDALPLFRHALELDPNFAMAYAHVGRVYLNLGENEVGAGYFTKAYELRERVSEREKLYIASHYHREVTGDTEQAIQILELWKQTYPHDYRPYFDLGVEYEFYMGQHEKALAEYREALRLDPPAEVYENLGFNYLALDRFDEAKKAAEQGQGLQLDDVYLHILLADLAFLRGDSAEVDRQFALGASQSTTENLIFGFQALIQASAGRLSKARELFRRAVQSAQRNGMKESSANWESTAALVEAYFGNRHRARQEAAAALAISSSRNVQTPAALALAWAGDATRALAISANLTKRYPKNIPFSSYYLLSSYYLPIVRAVVDLNRGNAVGALDLLEETIPYEAQYCMDVAYARGEAYLANHQAAAAAAEFQKMLDHRGLMSICPQMPLAHLGLARARALSGDSAGARNAYQDFLGLWKDADPNIPILRDAKAEYAKLQ